MGQKIDLAIQASNCFTFVSSVPTQDRGYWLGWLIAAWLLFRYILIPVLELASLQLAGGRGKGLRYYLRETPNGLRGGVWLITETEAVRVDKTNAVGGVGTHFTAAPGEDIFAAISRQATGWFGLNGENPFHEAELGPGKYYPRMARPHEFDPFGSIGTNPVAREEQEVIFRIRNQITLLASLLSDIFQTIHPVQENMRVYGSNIRNLLILAAMEVEAQWKAILRANGITSARMSTNDYVKLLPAMKLDAYSVSLAEFPWLAPISPFAAWQALCPTESLDWYCAYNSTKHDRESAFAEATLERAVAAVCANVVLLIAQYGVEMALGKRRLRDEFRVGGRPSWSLGEVYIHPYSPAGWTSKQFQF